jgi:ABC-type multidrug transport system ATPase subunit
MNIEPGRMVLLLGGSGAGKTTFINAVTGYEKANAQILLGGMNVYDEYDKMKYSIGFVPQLDLIRSNDTVYRTLMDAALLRLPADTRISELLSRVESVLEQFGLASVKSSLVEKLSGGQRKRLSIAMEFLSNPSLFILDEPDSGLDGVMARELFEQLRQIADQGKIIIVITHTPDRVIDLFDDVIVLAKDAKRTGRLAWFGPIEEARKFFGKEKMEEIVKSVNREEEGGEGRADEFIMKFAEVQHV